MKNSVIIGAGTHGQIYASYLKEAGINIIGFIDDNPNLIGKEVINIPVIGKYKDLFLQEFKDRIQDVYCPIGVNAVRIEYLSTLKKEGYGIPSFFHHTVSIGPDVILGEAIYMLAGNSVMPHTTIGSYIMINSSSTIAHHVTLEDGVFMSSGVNIGALMRVKKNAYIGMGVTIMTGVRTIGKETLLGAGTVVINDIPDYAVVVGNPGRVLRTKKPQDIFSFDNNEISDVTFIGSGISSSFSIINFLKSIKNQSVTKKIKITIIEKSDEFHLGLPYGEKSGYSVHLVTSLGNFLPEPELSEFLDWLISNKTWLLNKFKKDGGILAQNWIETHQVNIENNNWEPLFIPRRFFGQYLEEKITSEIDNAIKEKKIEVSYVKAEVFDLKKTNDFYKIYLKDKSKLTSKKVVLSVGSLPTMNLWKEKALIKKDRLLFINQPYKPSLNGTLNRIKKFVRKNKTTKINVAIIGANASGLEMLYKLNDHKKIGININKFTVLSTLGVLPDSIIDKEKSNNFSPFNLCALNNEKTLTAKQIAEATYKDLGIANGIKLGAASTVEIISKTLGSLLGKLNESELIEFACKYGNEIDRRQRCAGYNYTKIIDELKNEGRFEHIAGRFTNLKKNNTETHYLEYLDTNSNQQTTLPTPIHIVINCIGSTNFDNKDVPELLSNLIENKLCEPNSSKIGVHVNNSLEASENLHIIGPLVAGNILEGNAVWDAEHCERIVWLSKLLTKQLNNYFLKENKVLESM